MRPHRSASTLSKYKLRKFLEWSNYLNRSFRGPIKYRTLFNSYFNDTSWISPGADNAIPAYKAYFESRIHKDTT